jgi:hypothetical protein
MRKPTQSLVVYAVKINPRGNRRCPIITLNHF